MSGSKGLARNDIVGQQVSANYESPWNIDIDGFGACTTFIELASGATFALQCQDVGSFPIIRIEPNELSVNRCTDPLFADCVGKIVVEVLASEYWPGIGLLLSNQYLVFQRDFPDPGVPGALLIGGHVEKVGQTYSLTDVIPYWEQV